MRHDPLAMPEPLQGVKVKLRRAREHLDAFALDAQLYVEEAFVTSRFVTDGGRLHEYRVRCVKPPPLIWGALIGDCLHNMRSALDYLVYDLASASVAPRSLVSAERSACKFPIHHSAASFDNEVATMPFLSEEIVSRIRGVQPFHRGGGASHADPLAILQRLNNQDKHRLLHTTGFALEWSAYNKPTVPHNPTFHGGRLDHGQRVAIFEFDDPLPDYDVEFDPRFQVVIESHGLANQGAWRVLNQILVKIDNEVAPFLFPLLDGSPP